MSAGLEALCAAQQTKTPEAAVRSACLHLLKACKIEDHPVPLKPLLEALDVDFTWSPSGPNWRPGHGTASLKPVNGRLKIFIHEQNAHLNWRRCRFSIAHELIHALLIRMLNDSKLIASLDATKNDLKQLEALCNIGAAELLMPSSKLRTAVRKHGLSPNGLLKLYDEFLVSKDALIWRIAAMTPYSSVTKWRKYSRNRIEEHRFRVLSCYPLYEKKGDRPWLPPGATTKHLSRPVIEEVGENKNCVSENNLQVNLNKKNWTCLSIATFFQRRDQSFKQPQFENFFVPDEIERKNNNDILLFVAHRAMVDSDKPWEGKFWG